MLLRRIETDSEQGSLTAFASDINGVFYGISAAHSLRGPDEIIQENDLVTIWSEMGNRAKYNACGIVTDFIYENENEY
jgi:hypothetical protein